MYKLPPLPRGPVNVTVVAQGWMPALKKVEITPGMKPVDFRLEPGKELRLRVVDRSGKPIPAVNVSIDRWRGVRVALQPSTPQRPRHADSLQDRRKRARTCGPGLPATR